VNCKRTIFWLVTLAALWLPQAAQACAVCFGNPDSKLNQGMLAGVFVLLMVVVAVLGGFVALFVFLARRAAEAAALEEPSKESKA
jgi:heme/copper-type cytochrome/quinol oxidase subunit 2